jgi:TPR repeat protein
MLLKKFYGLTVFKNNILSQKDDDQVKKYLFIIPLLILGQLTLSSSIAYAFDQNWYAKGLQAEFAGDYQTAIAYYTKSANMGLSDANFAIGRSYKMLGNDISSLEWFLKAAKAGNKFAQYEAGLIYLNGSSATVANSGEAEKWFTFAAKSNHGEAAYEIFNLNQDEKWLKQAAEQGVQEAMQGLANLYKSGANGFEVDIDESKRWTQRVVESKE